MDYDFARLYQAETNKLKRQERRNIERSPNDVMFEPTPAEYYVSESQNGTLKQ